MLTLEKQMQILSRIRASGDEEAVRLIDQLIEERDEARCGDHSASECEPTWAQLSSFWRTQARAAQARIKAIMSHKPDDATCASAAMSYNHGFGLMPPEEQVSMMHMARFWLEAWQKEMGAFDRSTSPLPRPESMDLAVDEANPQSTGAPEPKVARVSLADREGYGGNSNPPRRPKTPASVSADEWVRLRMEMSGENREAAELSLAHALNSGMTPDGDMRLPFPTMPENPGQAVLARRLYLHVRSGGALTEHDLSRLVVTIEELERKIADLQAGRMQYYRHRKGGLYLFIGPGRIEASLDPVVIYRSVSDGSLWVRPESEFMDGRFTLLT